MLDSRLKSRILESTYIFICIVLLSSLFSLLVSSNNAESGDELHPNSLFIQGQENVKGNVLYNDLLGIIGKDIQYILEHYVLDNHDIISAFLELDDSNEKTKVTSHYYSADVETGKPLPAYLTYTEGGDGFTFYFSDLWYVKANEYSISEFRDEFMQLLNLNNGQTDRVEIMDDNKDKLREVWIFTFEDMMVMYELVAVEVLDLKEELPTGYCQITVIR